MTGFAGKEFSLRIGRLLGRVFPGRERLLDVWQAKLYCA